MLIFFKAFILCQKTYVPQYIMTYKSILAAIDFFLN